MTNKRRYTLQERRQISLAFVAAKKILWDGNSALEGRYRYICHALESRSLQADIRAREIIEARLGGYGSLDGWLNARGVTYGPFGTDNNKLMQAHRHAWLDMLIKEFSK